MLIMAGVNKYYRKDPVIKLRICSDFADKFGVII